jgi:heat-inducible transcriptional repressor
MLGTMRQQGIDTEDSELDDRKAAILKAVVSEYVATAQPVGSQHVVRNHELAVSPATVRNEMALLEAEGYLSQPHTSAGRVPTSKGYRYFVDHLLPSVGLDPASAKAVRDFFARAHGELERLLADTSRLLSELTHCAAVVVPPDPAEVRVRAAQLVDIGDDRVLAVVVLADASVEHRGVDAADLARSVGGLSADDVALASRLFGRALVGVTTSAPRPVAQSGSPGVDGLVRRALEVVAGVSRLSAPKPVFVQGTARMAEAFDAIGTVRDVLSTLEQQFMVVTLIRGILDRGLQVAIGSETGVEPLSECSIVVAPLALDGRSSGAVGVLGSMRMDYPHALSAVAVVGHQLEKMLRHGRAVG